VAPGRTTQVKPLISVGGIKLSLTNHTTLRLDFRDYISPFPENLFVTAGNKNPRLAK
jgi:hypothetical protein